MFKITAEAHFASAHQLRGYEGNCERLHGHNWIVIAQIATPVLNEIGIAYDFKLLSRHLGEIVHMLDHQYLNDVPPFDEMNPTSENLAKYIFHRLKEKLPEKVRMMYVEVKESSKYSATYIEESL